MKKLIFSLILIVITFLPAFAEKIPVKLMPLQLLSTEHDEIDVGDWIEFMVVNDVYAKDKCVLKKGSHIIGVVDFVNPNGWGDDDAEIRFKEFKVADCSGKNCEINSSLKIKIEDEDADTIARKLWYYVIRPVRGAEIFIEPDAKTFNIFIEQL